MSIERLITKCSVPQCDNVKIMNIENHIKFHQFPKDASLQSQWIEAIGRKEFFKKSPSYLSRHLCVCSFHFEPSCYTEKFRLKTNSIPTIFQNSKNSTTFTVKNETEICALLPSNTVILHDWWKPKDEKDISSIEASTSTALNCTSETETTKRERYLTEEKRQLTMKLKQLQEKNRALSASLRNSNEKLDRRNKKLSLQSIQKDQYLGSKMHYNDCVSYVKKVLPETTSNLIINSIRNKNSYADSIKEFSWQLFTISPIAYRQVRPILNLPSCSTLQRFGRDYISRNIGINYSILKQLKLKVDSGSIVTLDKHVILYLDKMSIKTFLEYDSTSDSLSGLEDYGSIGRTDRLASNALCGMIYGISKNFQQLISHIFVQTTDAKLLKKFLLENIKAVNDTGLKVVGVVTDQGSNFSGLFNSLGVTPNEPFFTIDDNVILIWPDECHILRSLRNGLYETVNGTSEGHIDKVYNICLDRTFNLIPKVIESDVIIQDCAEKIGNVAGCRILSRTFAKAIEELVEEGLLSKDALATSQFYVTLTNINSILNSCQSSKDTPSDFRLYKPLREISDLDGIWEYLEDTKTWLSQVQTLLKEGETVNKTEHSRCIQGQIQAITAIKLLFQTMINDLGYEYDYIRRLEQDFLVGNFGRIRSLKGHGNNPTSLEFSSLFRKITVAEDPHFTSGRRNCERVLIKNYVNLNECQQMTFEKLIDSDVPILPRRPHKKQVKFEVANLEEPLERKALMYISGVMARKLDRLHKRKHCAICEKAEVSRTEVASSLYRKQFASLRRNAKRGIRYSSKELCEFAKDCERVFSPFFAEHFTIIGLSNKLVDILLDSNIYNFIFCTNYVKRSILKCFVVVRIRYTLKGFNNKFRRLSLLSSKSYRKKRMLKNKKR